MSINLKKILLLSGIGASSVAFWANINASTSNYRTFNDPPPDSLATGGGDSISVPESTNTSLPTSITPPVDSSLYKDRFGDPINNPSSKSPFVIQPSSNEVDIRLSPDLSGYEIHETAGDSIQVRPPSKMSPQEFAEYRRKQLMKEYWDQISVDSVTEERDSPNPLNKIIYKPGTTEPLVEIKPAGSVNVRFGGRWQKTENPAVPRNLQRTGSFDFDQQIKINLQGDIGERLKVNANWNTNATFEFDNQLQVAFDGKEEDWLRDIQAGNISVPLNTQLITGAQKLFGIKTVMQFGKVGVTSFVSSQQGKRESIVIQGGGQARQFEFPVSEYDAYKHFYLGHYFRDIFEQAYLNNPTNPNNGFTINRVEAFITNTNSNTQGLKNIVAFTDLGEAKLARMTNGALVHDPSSTLQNASNETNKLFEILEANSAYRNADFTIQILESFGFVAGQDFEKINNARSLEEDVDFTFHQELGFISLNRKLQDDEALAVSFEYTLNGQNYTVGELKDDYQSLGQDEVIIVKMLKPSRVDLTLPTWDLMMKNIYSLNTNRVSSSNFQLRIIYKDDITGIDNPSLQEGNKAKNVSLLKLLQLDKLDPNGDRISDGNFDFIPEATVLTRRGHLLFPTPEPFGDFMERDEGINEDGETVVNYFFENNVEQNLKNKYVFEDLYDNTQAEARRSTEFNKFFIKGQYESATSQNIRLPGFGVSEGSVTVRSGSISLVEGVDYSVNYSANTVNILSSGVFESGNDIIISYEAPDLFRFRAKSLIGTRIEYNHNKNFNFGTTLMKISEAPLVQRISVGDEPLNNTQIGADFSFQKESRLLTKMVDFLPVIQTKAPSSINGSFEAAMLLPGSSRILEDGGASYIDDFEGAETPYDFSRSLNQWIISTPPRQLGDDFNIFDDYNKEDISVGDHRAKLSWFNADQSFFVSGLGNNIDGFGDQEFHLENNYTRGINITDIFKGTQPANNLNNFVNTFNLMYYPSERGPYNYNVLESDLNTDGTFKNPKNNWAGLTRAITQDTDFENANIEFLEFWVMDPFQDDIYNVFSELNGVSKGEMGGEIYFNLGDISEDVIKDKRHGFENGLPDNVDSTDFGFVTNETFLNNAFEASQDRSQQDKGFDGLTDDEERSQDFFGPLIDSLQRFASGPSVDAFSNDPSSDNFAYYINSEDESNGSNPGGRNIIERYKNFNGYDGNSPIGSVESSSTLPDNEDLNNNKTLDEIDRYFQYSMPINTDVFNGTADHPLITGINQTNDVTYYQVRIPIRDYDKAINGISSFNTIKYMRMYLTGFAHPVALRMVNLQLVSAQWRKYVGYDLDKRAVGLAEEPQSRRTFVSTVNVEENDEYALPRGMTRDVNQSSINNSLQNEQSLQICTDELRGNVGVGAFKNITVDLINYKRIRMFIHGESSDPETRDDDLNVFLRLGTDLTSNYYEISLPLKLSEGTAPIDEVSKQTFLWPEDNDIDLAIEELTQAKLDRNSAGFATNRRFSKQVGKYTITVVGSPDRSSVRTAMLGMHNNTSDDKSACVWLNELRVAEFDKSLGWATVGNVNAQLADLGSVSGSVRFTSANYGDIETKLAERTRDNNLSYGAQTNLALHKFGADKIGIQLPFFASIEGQRVTPKFDPFDPDVEFNDSKDSKTSGEADTLNNVATYTKSIKSINLTNVKKVKVKQDAKSHFFDVENINLTLSYKEETRKGAQPNSTFGNAIDEYKDQNYLGRATYAYNFNSKPFAPFKKAKWKSSYTKIIKDININPIPSSFSVTGTLNRRYFKNQLLNSNLDTTGVAANYEKSFTFDRLYSLRWNLTKSLNINYSATANALIDEPEGGRTENENGLSSDRYQEIVWENLKDLGRLKNFDQSANITYKLPINKIPIFSWVTSEAKYKVSTNWQASAFQDNPDSNDPSAEPIPLQDIDSVTIGNFMSNNVDFKLNTKLNFVKLYSKSKFLKEMNATKRRTSRPASATVQPDPNDTLKTKKPRKKLKDISVIRTTVRSLMLVRNLKVDYNRKLGTDLPGVLSRPNFLGVDDRNDYAPGVPFLLGSQNLNLIKNEGTGNGWYSRSQALNTPIQQIDETSITAQASIEPFKDFRIKVDASYNQSELYQETFRWDEDSASYRTLSPVYSGSLKMTYITLPTAFSFDGTKREIDYFGIFNDYRHLVADQLNANDVNGEGTYSNKGSDALIPAFLAAYSGKKLEAGNISNEQLRTSPRIPLPNWRVDYAGLSRLPKMRKKFSAFSIKHSYKSTVDVRSFKSSTEYNNIDYQTSYNNSSNVSDLDTNSFGNYKPLIIVEEVQISERFSPLIGINIRTRKSKLNFKIDYNKSRVLTLDMNNFQITEVKNDDIVLGFGKTWRGAQLPFRVNGEKITLKNNLTLKTDLSIRNQKTVQRKFEESAEDSESNEASVGTDGTTSGNLNFQLRPNLNYQYSKKLNIQLFFERTINVPKVSTQFVRKTTAFGVNVRFSLT